MTYFADLSTRTQIASGPGVRAIGWLSDKEPYPRGQVPESFLARLVSFCTLRSDAILALGWPAAAGHHTCEFCNEFYASENVGVPAGNLLYVAPKMVAHYVERHEYLPPSEFIDAVLIAPLPGTQEYADAVRPFIGATIGY
jgi:hypothetical protein